MDESVESVDRLRRLAVQHLESLQRAGVKQLLRRAPPEPVASDEPPPVRDKAATIDTAQEEESLVKRSSGKDAASELAVLQQEVAGCTRCAELARTRTQTVFGVGDPHARLCFFGEAPGADEDRLGEPFVGRAGKLLTDIIEKGMGLTREDVYILNVLKCRPPGNRNPNPDEASNCREYFERQFAAIRPEFICCLGTVAAHNLLETNVPVGRLRGKVHQYGDIRVVVTYHPSYLLRNPSAKQDTWKDIQMLLREMGLPVPKR